MKHFSCLIGSLASVGKDKYNCGTSEPDREPVFVTTKDTSATGIADVLTPTRIDGSVDMTLTSNDE